MSNDRELVQQVLARQHGAFERLVAQYQRLVWHLVYRMVHQVQDCEDLCQEVFLRVHQRLGQFRFESALGTWIGRIAFSTAARHMQRRRIPLVEDTDDAAEQAALVERVADDFDLEAAVADGELMGRLVEALEALSPVQRTLVTLYHLEELGIPEIARITDLPEGTIKNYLFRARRRLRDRIAPMMGADA